MTQFTLRLGSAVLYRGGSLSDVAALVQANRVTLRPAPADDLRFFSVCSGIEAASVAWKPIGWKCIGVAEIEKFPSAVLAHHYPDIPNHGDFTKIETNRLGRVDVLCGGTPCQAFSVAGARRSLDDARGNLTLAFVGLAHELADGNELRNVIWENVPGVLSTKDNAFGCFLAGLVGADEPLVPIEHQPPLENLTSDGVGAPRNGHTTLNGRAQGWSLDQGDVPPGPSKTLNTSAWPNDASVSSLSQILEAGPIPPQYFLSQKACAGILRRAEKRGKELPQQLAHALRAVAALEPIST